MYSGCRFVEYRLSYSAQERYAGSEVAFLSDELALPDVGSPANVKLSRGARPTLAGNR